MGLDYFIEKLRMGIGKLTPSLTLLDNTVDRIPCGGELSPDERFSVKRGLERVWHIMRLLDLLSRYFGDRIFFGGGAIINYIYMVNHGEPPRLTFDLDAAWYRRVGAKRVILKEMVLFNKWLDEQGYTLDIPVSHRDRVKLYIVEYDVEKDYFPDILSLRIPVLTRYDGRPFYQFLNIEDYGLINRLRRVFMETMGVRDPRIDYIRFEVSLDPNDMPRSEEILRDMFGYTYKALITPVEYQLASDIDYWLGRDYGEDIKYTIHDILKATLDLRLLDHVDKTRVKEYLHKTPGLKDNIDKNLTKLLILGEKIWRQNYHYTLIRKKYKLKEIVKHIKNIIQPIIHDE